MIRLRRRLSLSVALLTLAAAQGAAAQVPPAPPAIPANRAPATDAVRPVQPAPAEAAPHERPTIAPPAPPPPPPPPSSSSEGPTTAPPPPPIGGTDCGPWGCYVFVQNIGRQSVAVVVFKPNKQACTKATRIPSGNRLRLYSCGRSAVLGLNDGAQDIFTNVELGHVYEIYPDAGRWKVRNADVE